MCHTMALKKTFVHQVAPGFRVELESIPRSALGDHEGRRPRSLPLPPAARARGPRPRPRLQPTAAARRTADAPWLTSTRREPALASLATPVASATQMRRGGLETCGRSRAPSAQFASLPRAQRRPSGPPLALLRSDDSLGVPPARQDAPRPPAAREPPLRAAGLKTGLVAPTAPARLNRTPVPTTTTLPVLAPQMQTRLQAARARARAPPTDSACGQKEKERRKSPLPAWRARAAAPRRRRAPQELPQPPTSTHTPLCRV